MSKTAKAICLTSKRSENLAKSIRPAKASIAAAVTQPAVAAWPSAGSSSDTWCVRKPICTMSAKPKVRAMLRSASVRSASARDQTLARGLFACETGASPSGYKPRSCGRWRKIKKLTDHTVLNNIRATMIIALLKPNQAIKASRMGTPTMPPILAPSIAVETARPWCRSNQGASEEVIAVVDKQDQPRPIRAKDA